MVDVNSCSASLINSGKFDVTPGKVKLHLGNPGIERCDREVISPSDMGVARRFSGQ